MRSHIAQRLGAGLLAACIGLSAAACNDSSGGGAAVASGTNNVQFASTDNGGGSYTITVTGEELGALGVRGISFDLRLQSSGAESLSASASGPFFQGGSVAAGFGTGGATLLHVGAGLPPSSASTSANTRQTMLTLQLASAAVSTGGTATLSWRVENLRLFDADPGGAFAMQIAPGLFSGDGEVEVTVTG